MSSDITSNIPYAKTLMQTLMRQLSSIENGDFNKDKIRATNSTVDRVMKIFNSGIERGKLELATRKEDSKSAKNVIAAVATAGGSGDDGAGYLEDIYNIKLQIRQFNQTEYPKDISLQNIMPTAKQLAANPVYAPLIQAIDDYHGGFKRVAEILGLEYKP